MGQLQGNSLQIFSFCVSIKGIVHPKMKMLSSFTHYFVPKLCVLFFFWTQKNFFKEYW